MKSQRGFTFVEVVVVIGILFILLGFISVNLFKFQHKSQLSSTVSSFLADYKEQQIKAMAGDTDNTGAVANYGVHIEATSYTVFRNTYGTSNFTISLPSGTQASTTFPSSQIIFTAGSGQLTSFTGGQNTITFTDTGDGSTKTVTINTYGVVTSVN
jgi:prepilin-type N-terminal cleavage/methylation domain-containing protein